MGNILTVTVHAANIRDKDALTGYYERGVAIPPTSQPGAFITPASEVWNTLVGNRMKGRRATLPNEVWLKRMTAFQSFVNLKF